MARPETRLVMSYTKVMAVIQRARAAGSSQGTLVDSLRRAAKARDVALLVAMARVARGSKKNHTRADFRKDAGALFQLLPPVPKTSPNAWDQEAVRRFVYESFRARAISLTAARHAAGLCRRPLPRWRQPYALRLP